MVIKFNIGKLHFFFEISIQRKVIGVNSQILNSDKHILLWDFDNISLSKVKKSLKKVQDEFALSNIYILKTSESSYHAYCFTAVSFPLAMYILASTPNIDQVFFKLGVMRGFWTLRISDRKGKKKEITQVAVLKSNIPEDVKPEQVATVSYYWTRKG